MKWYMETLQDVIKNLSSNVQTGLTEDQVKKALEQYGENQIEGKKKKPFIAKFFEQLKDYMVIILIIAAVVSFVIALMSAEGDFIDSIIIIGIVILNALLGVMQEGNAEKALDALKSMSAPNAKVIRGGVVKQLEASKLVPGDIIQLDAGDFVPADARLIESASLKCEESALTGESVPVDKYADKTPKDNAPLGDRLNMVYSGCSVTYGRAKAIVVSTGMNTEMGKIAQLLNKETEELTPLQQKLNQLGKYLGILAIVACVIIFVVGILKGETVMDMVMTSISLAVAAIPEGLTAVVTIVLALGIQRMVKQNAIIRKLPAVETLGSASVICSDKTGTLTQNKMTVKKVWPENGNLLSMEDKLTDEALNILKLGTLCNDGKIESNGQLIGDPTETAIVAAALKNGMAKSTLDEQNKRIGEIPFDSNRKLMTTIHMMDGKTIVIVKGGFDVLLPRCISPNYAIASKINEEMAQEALRVLAVAYKNIDHVPDDMSSEALENELTFLGLIGMIDPPREESKIAVETCKKAGIKTVMITGDHILTASAIASELGILKDKSEAISGEELAKMSDQQLKADVEKYAVYARVSPEDKIRIVKAWQSNGKVVSMTGDGVNDAPALKAADIGCAMGITGTDVAKGAADMVLTDDNFSTIVEAVRQGRGIYSNIKKTVEFLLGSNLGEVLTVFFAMIVGWGSPLMAIHLLLINVVTDAFPAFAIGVENVDKDIMKQKPIPKDEGIFANNLGIKIAFQGIMFAALTLSGYYIGSFVSLGGATPSHQLGQTISFLVLSLASLVHAWNCRSKYSLFKIGFFSNKQMVYACCISLTIILCAVFIAPVREVFKLSSLPLDYWILVLGLSIAPLVIFEIIKLFLNKKVEA